MFDIFAIENVVDEHIYNESLERVKRNRKWR